MRVLLSFLLVCFVWGAHAQLNIVTRAGLPAEGRDDAVAAVVQGVLYTGSGLTSGFYNTNDWWKYDFESDSWQQLPNMPLEPRQYIKGFTYKECIYLFGGYQNEQNTFNDLWRYHTQTGEWTQLDSLPGNRRWGSFAFTLGEYAYIGGGKDTLQYLADFYRYHIPTNTWKRLPDLPFGPRGHGISAANNESAFLGLGANDTANTHGDLWKFEGRTETFTKVTELDSGLWRAGAARMLYDTQQWELFVWGGERKDQGYSNQLYAVNERTGNYTKQPLHFGAANRGTTMLAYRNGAALLFGVNAQIQRQASFHYLEPQNPITAAEELQFYPNPVEQYAKVVVRSLRSMAQLEVYTLRGTRAYMQQLEPETRALVLPLPALAKGMYVLRCTFQNGTTQTHKFLVQ